MPAAKKLFNKFLVIEQLPSADAITAADVMDPGSIQSLFFRWGDGMMASPPMQLQNRNKRLDAGSVGNYFGLVPDPKTLHMQRLAMF